MSNEPSVAPVGPITTADRDAARRQQARDIGFKSLPATPGGKRQRFLLVLRESANISRAARAAGIATVTVYGWRKKMPSFRAAWDDAMNEAFDNLEEVLRDRAINGVERPHFHHGELSRTYRTYSDNLGMSIFRARRPEIFGSGANDTTGDDKADISVAAQLDRIAKRVADRKAKEASSVDAAPLAGPNAAPDAAA